MTPEELKEKRKENGLCERCGYHLLTMEKLKGETLCQPCRSEKFGPSAGKVE